MINSIKHLTTINGKKICNLDSAKNVESLKTDGKFDWDKFDEFRKDFPISVDDTNDMISFKMLTKPASEGGNMELCQWSDIVTLGLEQLKYFQSKFPCRENAIAITKIEEGLMWNEKRTADRIKRNVEGKDLK